MKIVVDTSVWSLALRRKPGHLSARERPLTQHLADLIKDDRVVMLGPIRQELLSGIRWPETFDRLKRRLREYDDEPLTLEDYESAAETGNACRAAGVSGSAIDFLICAIAERRGLAIFTIDQDFAQYAGMVPITLHSVEPQRPPKKAR